MSAIHESVEPKIENSIEQLYLQRLNRYVTAMRNGKPDRIPIRPFAEFAAKYAGYSRRILFFLQ